MLFSIEFCLGVVRCGGVKNNGRSDETSKRLSIQKTPRFKKHANEQHTATALVLAVLAIIYTFSYINTQGYSYDI